MASGINKVILLGYVGKDPDAKTLNGGQTVCTFSLATNKVWVKDGQKQERVEWHRVVTWGKLAEVCAKYVEKGKQLYIEGEIQTREWKDKEGEKKYTTEIQAREVVFLGGGSGKKDSGGSSEEPPPPDVGDVPF